MKTERKAEYERYLASPEWQALRLKALERAAHRCALCNSGKELHVHHRTYERFRNESLDDLTVLCKSCHWKFHDSKGKPKKRRSYAKDYAEAQAAVEEAVEQLPAGKATFTTGMIANKVGFSKSVVSVRLIRMAAAGRLLRISKARWRWAPVRATPTRPIDEHDLEDFWRAVLTECRGSWGAMLKALLHEAVPVLTADAIVLKYPYTAAFSMRKVGTDVNREAIETAIRTVASRWNVTAPEHVKVAPWGEAAA